MRNHRRTTRHPYLPRFTLAISASAALVLTACATTGDSNGNDDTDGEEVDDGGEITAVTHASFNLPDELIADFEAETGYDVTFTSQDDAGALTNQLILTADNPLGDVVFGIDNTFATRAIDEGVLDPYTSDALPDSAEQYLLDDGAALTPIDRGDVCINIDNEWFAQEGIDEPETFDDLLDEQYQDLTVVTNPATSSPGLAFLTATIGAMGEDWEQYWQDLTANGLLAVEGWSDAYYVDFSGADGEGPRPIVLSYSTSPSATLTEDGSESTTTALLDTCFRQVEYAGVIAGADNPEGAQAFIDFLLSDDVQAAIPQAMFMYPVNESIELPQEWEDFAPLSDNPHQVPAEDIADNREQWIETWTSIVLG